MDGEPRASVRAWVLEPEDPRWLTALDRLDHDVYHLPSYVRLEAQRMAGEPIALLAEASGELSLLPLVLRPAPGGRFDATSPYGYPAPLGTIVEGPIAQAMLDAQLEWLRERGVIAAFVRGHPLLRSPRESLAGQGKLVEQGETVWIDLTSDPQAQWAGYRATHRNLIRRLRREGFCVELDFSCTQLEEFFAVYAATMERVGADWASFGREYVESLRDALGSHLLIGLVRHAGTIAAAGLFTRRAGIVQYHLSGTAPAFVRASPTRLLLDEVRIWASGEGMRALHLGGGVGSRDDALFRFKAGFSGARGRFWTWRAILDPQGYLEAVEAALGSAAVDDQGFFPAYRRPVSNQEPT